MIENVLTTGEAARIAGISLNSIIRCIDRGLLPGFKVPGSTHRRVRKDDLERFMRIHNMKPQAERLADLAGAVDDMGAQLLQMALRYDCGHDGCDGTDCPAHAGVIALAEEAQNLAARLRADVAATETKAEVYSK